MKFSKTQVCRKARGGHSRARRGESLGVTGSGLRDIVDNRSNSFPGKSDFRNDHFRFASCRNYIRQSRTVNEDCLVLDNFEFSTEIAKDVIMVPVAVELGSNQRKGF